MLATTCADLIRRDQTRNDKIAAMQSFVEAGLQSGVGIRSKDELFAEAMARASKVVSFKLSVEAEEDIIAIAEQGVRIFGAGQAKRYHDELFAIFHLIAVIHASRANGMRLIRPFKFIPSKRI